MAQENPYAKYVPAQPAPQAPPPVTSNAPPPFIGGTVSPTKQAADARDQTRTTLAVQGAARDDRRETRDVTKVKFDQESKLRDDFNMNPQVKAYRNSMVMLSQALRAPKNGQGDLSVIYAYANLMDPESVVREGEMDMVTLSSPMAQSTYQRLKGQLDSSGRLPPETRRNLDQEMIRTTQARRKAYDAQFKDYGARAGQYGLDPFAVVGTHAGEMFRAEMQDYDKERGIGRFAENPELINPVAGTANGATPPDGTPGPDNRRGVAKGDTRFVPDDEVNNTIASMYANGSSHDEIAAYAATRGYRVGPPDKAALDWAKKHPGWNPYASAGRQEKVSLRQKAAASGAGGYAGGAANALTFGLNDELYGLGSAALGGDYTQARDEFQGLKRGVADESPIADLVGNVTGGLLIGPTAAAVGSRVAPAATSNLITLAANNPIKTAALYGAGYGAGESNQNRVGGAAIGGLGGVVGGAAGKYVVAPSARAIADSPAGQQINALAASAINRARSPRPGISNVDDVAAAGAQEGVDVNRAMVDPALQNRVTGVDASMAGGPKFQRGMTKIEGQIEGRVNDLGQGGTPLNKVALGQQTQAAGERFIKDSGKKAGALYTRAEKMAGAAKVEPKTSLALADDILTGLSETPSTNAAEIAFLKGLKSDLSKDLSVGGLRRMRTSLRKKISKGELVFGEDEATVLKIMDAAADDITDGLQKQGLGNAAQAFKRADTEYRGRMEYINGTLQKIIGKRGSNLPAERVADNLTAMARGKDEIGVKKFMDTLTPDERIDTAATFAEALGKNNKEDFSVAHFLTQTSEKNFPQGALRVVFGDEGAASIARLRVLSKEVGRVTGSMNSRKSGTAVGNDYRSWLFNTLLGTAPGAASGSMGTALTGAGLTLGAKAGRDIISARSLLSKDITKWLEKAPKTTNPKAINTHLSQLSVVAGSQSPYRMDAQQIANYLRDAITNKSTTAAAAGEQEQN